jgi:uncharacterized SAM-dependent methyltransferase
LLDDAPILYSLLGNTVANTDDDADLLTLLGELLRPQDRLLLEVSTTSDLSDEALREAWGEYANSEAYRIHATSALGQFTDLTIDNRMLVFESFVEDDRAIRIETRYQNSTGQPMTVALPNRATINFAVDEAIRVTLARKYLLSGVDALIGEAGLTRVNDRLTQPSKRSRRPAFSRDLLLLAKAPAAPRRPSVADDLLRSGKTAKR